MDEFLKFRDGFILSFLCCLLFISYQPVDGIAFERGTSRTAFPGLPAPNP